MKNQELTLLDHVNSLDTLREQIMTLDPYKAYLFSQQLAKVAKSIQDDTKDEFKSYVDMNKELPFGFQCQIRAGRRMYAFEEDMEWSMLNQKMKDREEFLKMISDIEAKGGKYCDSETGEVHDGVKITYASDSYAVTRK